MATLSSVVCTSKLTMIGTITKSDGQSIVDTLNKTIYSRVPTDMNWFIHNRYSVTTGADQSFDLASSLQNGLGEAASLTKVYGFEIRNLETTSGRVFRVGNSNFASWLGSATDYVVVGPGGVLLLNNPIDGYTVTATSGDVFTVNNPGANTQQFEIVLYGKV